MAKDTNLKFGKHAPRESPTWPMKKIREKGAVSGSRDPQFFGR